MFGECHAHIIMDGINYKEAISLHKEAVNEEAIRRNFKAYQEQGITFVRGRRRRRWCFQKSQNAGGRIRNRLPHPLFLPSTKTGTMVPL